MNLCTCIGSNVYIMHAHNLGLYLKGQGHRMTLKQNHVRPFTLLCEVGFYKYFTEMITVHHIETCHAQDLGRYLEGQGHIMTFQHNRVWPISMLFEIGFYNYFTEMTHELKH